MPIVSCSRTEEAPRFEPHKLEEREKSNQQIDRVEREAVESIAIVGLALKFPKDATSPETFWQVLLHGRSAMNEVLKDLWNIDTFYHPESDQHDCMDTRNGHFLREHMAIFDAPFFSLPPSEVSCMQAKYKATGTGTAMLASRLSWLYDFHRPSISLDNACSSSLDALHPAVKSIRAGERHSAIDAGCYLIRNPETNQLDHIVKSWVLRP